MPILINPTSQQSVFGPVITDLIGVVLPRQSKTLTDRIADGKYDYVNSDITSAFFPLTLPAGPRDIVLARFNKQMSSKEVQRSAVERWAKENGYELATIEDLLAVGSHSEYRELQRKFPIIAFGSSAFIRNCERVPYLDRAVSDRRLRLAYCCRSSWPARYRFLLRKVSKLSVP